MGNKSCAHQHNRENPDQLDNASSNEKQQRNSSIKKLASAPEFSEAILGWSFQSFGSLRSHNSQSSACSVSRPWSRVSRRQWHERTLTDPLAASKTAWPVPFTESLFLPTFRIRDDVTEDSFYLIGELSNGAFGTVFKVGKIDTGRIYAMKILSKAMIIAGNAVEQVKDEVHIQHSCGHHPLIVSCPFYWQSRKQLFIVSDFVPGGELLRLLQTKGPLPEDIARIYVAQLALVLDFLHNAGVIYRDLKLENILLGYRGEVQLVDFGLAKWLKYGARTRTLCGTLQYIAPEVLLRQPYGHAADWWSLGIVVCCLLKGEMPYPCCIEDEDIIRPIPNINCSKAAKDLINRLLVPDPTKRLRSLTALERIAFFKDFRISSALTMPIPIEGDIESTNN